MSPFFFFFFQAEDGIRDYKVTGVQTCALPILHAEPAIVGFDALNEPEWGTYAIFDFEQDRLEPLYVKVTNAVRAAAPHWVAFLEPGASRNQGIATGLTKFPFADVVYAPHSYDAGAESGAGFDPTHR